MHAGVCMARHYEQLRFSQAVWVFHIRANLLMVKTYESAQKRRALGLSGHCGSSKDGSFEVLLIDILMTLLDRLDDGSDSSPSYLCQGK